MDEGGPRCSIEAFARYLLLLVTCMHTGLRYISGLKLFMPCLLISIGSVVGVVFTAPAYSFIAALEQSPGRANTF